MARSLLLLAAICQIGGSLEAEPDETALTSLSLVQLKASRHNRSALMEEFASEALAGATCAGGTTPGSTGWIQHSSGVIKVSVDTTVCGFAVTPMYVTSLGGNNNQWEALGGSEVYQPTATGFTIYIKYSSVTPTYANDREWHVNWIAHEEGKDTSVGGVTCAGKSSTWTQYNGQGIYTTVDTSACGFSAKPAYLSSLIGDGTSYDHYLTKGSSNAYMATATAATQFEIYIYKSGLTVADATANNWEINWVAHPDGTHSSGGVTCGGQTLSSAWSQYSSTGLYVDVDTSACGFSSVPRYVTSLGGDSWLWRLTGGSEIYEQTESGFKVYIQTPWTSTTPTSANNYGWHINWMATPETEVISVEDPHMSNVVGEMFNVLRPGTYTFVELPRGAGKPQLFISARVSQLLDKCHTGGLYVQSMNISGSLLNGVKPFTIDVVSKETDAMDVLHVKDQTGAMTAKEFAKANSGIATFDQPNSKRQNLHLKFGGIFVNIAGRRQDIQDRNVQIDFLDLRMKGLSVYKNVGGLLGTDDHTFASTAPVECATLMQTVPASGSANTGSRFLAN